MPKFFCPGGLANDTSVSSLEEARRGVAVAWNHFDWATEPAQVDRAVNETYRAEVEAARARRQAGIIVQAHRQGQQVRQIAERMIDSLAEQIIAREADRRWSRRVWVVVGVLLVAVVAGQVWMWWVR